MWITRVRALSAPGPGSRESTLLERELRPRSAVTTIPPEIPHRARAQRARRHEPDGKRRQLLREEACRMKSNWRARESREGCESGSGEGGMNGSELARAVPVIDLYPVHREAQPLCCAACASG